MLTPLLPKWFDRWNRKLHIYLGLYLLLFVWLFSISGLILNHPRWQFTQFWAQRKQTKFERDIQPPTAIGDVAKAKDLMGQLDLFGEIYQITTNPEKRQFKFTVFKPRERFRVQADLLANRAIVEATEVNAWGVVNTLHRLSGVRMNNPKEKRDWFWTKIWSFAMDAVAVGLIVMVLGGVYMWYQLKPKRRLGWTVLLLGVLSCGFFVFGLGWLP